MIHEQVYLWTSQHYAAAAASDREAQNIKNMKRENRHMDTFKLQTRSRCIECGRVFNLLNEEEAGEYYYGHDCEA
jgi:hypothetical protein